MFVTAILCCAITLQSNREVGADIYSAHSIAVLNKEEYSALLDGNVVFSAEKVAVNSKMKKISGCKDPNCENPEHFVPEAITSGSYKTFKVNYDDSDSNETYTFQDIENGKKNKTVIEDGKFVKLDNVYDGEKFIIDGNTGVQEAVMLSFGAYIFKPADDLVLESVVTNASTQNAGITYLEVSILRNGKKLQIPSIRNITDKDGELYFDFAYLITQQEDDSNEGYYQISLRYMVDYVEHTSSFEFYMLNNRSYEQSLNQDYGYNAKPTLGWLGGSEFSKSNSNKVVNEYVRYFIGKENELIGEVSYPTITYDYTRYKLNYVLTANQMVTTYDFSVVYNSNSGDITAKLVQDRTLYGETTTIESDLIDYDETTSTNLVTIMLTEPGSYVISYEYLYKGYNSENAPETEFESQDLKLAIHGMSLKYSKSGFESAKMQYFEIANKPGNNLDLVIPNGYNIKDDISGLANEKLGFVYKLVESNSREGNIILASSIDSLVNTSLKNQSFGEKSYFDILTGEGAIGVLEPKVENESIVIADDLSDYLSTILPNIAYAPTNQGSLWLEGNDEFKNKSFYFYSPSKFEAASELFNWNENGTPLDPADDTITSTKAQKFTNITSFNAKGYYLVFIQIDPNGINEDSYDYWQVFAFQYTSSSTNINIEAINVNNTPEITDDYEVIAGGKYTNKNVRISWKKPGIFDRTISPFYYSVENKNLSKDALTSTVKKDLKFEDEIINGETYCFAYLGEEVSKGSFVKYLIYLENEGDSATYKIFTIDRQDISGIMPYLIQEMYSGTLLYYSYATRADNTFIPITNSVTDGYATLTWDDKASGAEISATYSYTPFSINADKPIMMGGKNGTSWLTTNYGLGTTITGADLYKSNSEFNVSTECILFNQGIYIITLKDSAGNVTDYAFVIDKTANYFKVEDTYLSNNSAIYGTNVGYDVGDYKAFELDVSNASINADLKNFIVAASTEGNLSGFNNYYTGSYNNISALSKIFQSIGGKYYLTIKNRSVVAYENSNKVGTNLALRGQLNYYDGDGSTYYVCKLYVNSENHVYSTSGIDDKAYAWVEINHDNARGYVYYSDSSDFSGIPLDGKPTSDNGIIHKLQTGSDQEGVNGLKGADATSTQNLAFIWKMGTGKFEVAEVTYKFYTLKPNTFNPEQDGKYYFYGSGAEFDIYKEGNFKTSNAQSIGGGLALMLFNGSNQTKAGLYVVTRSYRDNEQEGFGEDVQTKNYYFIVDRNGIIDITAGVGGSIKLCLMENETEFLEFSTQGLDPNYLTHDNVIGERYYIYLQTNKLPAVLNIPTGKYLDDTHTSADYDAGRLNISVYFHDINNQLPQSSPHRGRYLKIFESTGADHEYLNDTFIINIYEYLSNVDIDARERLSLIGKSQDWLFLPGDYIVRITDNVVDGSGNTHVKNIGFRITGYEDDGPTVDNYTGYTSTDMIEITTDYDGRTQEQTNYSATVSQEFLEVRLSSYDVEKTKAQMDPKYLVVTQYYGDSNSGAPYIDHKYGIGVDKVYSEIAKLNADGSISVMLDTKLLRDNNGDIDKESLNIPLRYTITIRYKLNDTDLDKYNPSEGIDTYQRFKDCYVYYSSNGQKYYYFESTYTISIDRQAPKNNVENLNASDSLVEEFNEYFESEEMIQNGVHDSGSNLYFTKQYFKYYEEEKVNKGYIYPYQVNQETSFDTTDINKVYVKIIDDLSSYNLTLPLINSSNYTVNNVGNFDNLYSALRYNGNVLQSNSYYEIIEQDKAGNITQYVIHYNPLNFDISIPTTIQTTNGKTLNNINLISQESYNIYGLVSTGEITANQNTYILELNRLDSTNIFTGFITSTTDLNQMAKDIVSAITKENEGNIELLVKTRKTTLKTQINLYDSRNIKPLNVEDLVVKRGEKDYVVDLRGANKQNDKKTLWYFATNILIKTPTGDINFEGRIVDKEVRYYTTLNPEDGEVEREIWECAPDTTYYIIMTDILGTQHKYRFNTSGYEFVTLDFDAPGGYYEGDNGEYIIYYSYTSATLGYDSSVYSSKIYKKSSGVFAIDENFKVDEDSSEIYNFIRIDAPFDNLTGKGGIVEYKIELYDIVEEVLEQTKYITIDTRLSNVALRDYATGELRTTISYQNNLEYNSPSVIFQTPISGIMNFQWSEIEENNYFNYEYRLYEKLKDNNYRITTFKKNDEGKYDVEISILKDGQLELIGNAVNDGPNTVISTLEDSLGKYVFEVSVYAKGLEEGVNGIYLGNRLYSFEVHASSNKIYYVAGADEPNSSFKVKELKPEHRTLITGAFKDINLDVKLPLYVTNKDLQVVVADANVKPTELKVVENGQYYDFTIYQLKKEHSFEIYLGILKFNSNISNVLVENVKIIAGTSDEDVGNITSFTIAKEKGTDVYLQATRKHRVQNDYLFNKNELLLDVWYAGEKVSQEYFDSYYTIRGNGSYKFEFKDLAGNVHTFANESKELDVFVLREVVVLINDQQVVENAYYNDEASLTIVESSKYVTGSINVVATKNGVPYQPNGFNPYVFTDYGTYRVEVTAKYKDIEEPFKKVITFTVLNAREARRSIDLTGLGGCEISKVTNQYGDEITAEFIDMMAASSSGLNITYESILEKADKLKVTSGKQRFDIIYKVKDGIYPTREIPVSFTLNNEEVSIACSLEKGEKTTKGFTIYFNQALIYEKVGESYICVNDKVIAYIDASAQNAEQSYEVTYDNFGEGDAYVKLVSSSGVVLDSYKITINEPLNFWAIVVIIVVVAVVATVVITVIVLRRKMRIR